MMLVKTLAAELGPAAVRVNAIAPSIVATKFTEPIREDPKWGDAYARRTALGRWARPDELIGATVFLVSDASSFVTGTHLLVDGGWTAIDGRFDPPI
jgi:NAD(P)-dependent dehydrogenase (short-subunit alcohol dehydrogenase family)